MSAFYAMIQLQDFAFGVTVVHGRRSVALLYSGEGPLAASNGASHRRYEAFKDIVCIAHNGYGLGPRDNNFVFLVCSFST